VLMAILASVSYHAFVTMETLSGELNRMLLLDMFLDESMGSHRKWMNDLGEAFLLDQNFQGSLDPLQCEFGKWRHSFTPPDEETKEIHDRIERPHRILHESAKQILPLLYRPGRQRDLAHLMEEQKNKHMLWISNISKAIEEKDKSVFYSLEKGMCSLDQLYENFSASDKEGLSYLHLLEESHQHIHHLFEQVFQLIRHGRWKEAERFYYQHVMSANEEFVAHFSRLDTLVHQRIEGNRQAREIYARRTIPAMEELQQLVNRIRTNLMARIDKQEREYQRVAKRSKSFIIWSILFIISLATLFSVLIPPTLTRPIRHLTQFANRIATEGDLSETIQIKNRDEIGQLASSFNRMIQALRKSREESEEWGKTLEKKVELRTKDLKNACQKLETIQAHLVQSSKLASIGELAAGMAHEINNPMNVIVSYAELLLDEIMPNTEPHTYAQGILEASLRISKIIKDLLIFARQGKLECSNVSVPALIDLALSFMQRRLEKENILIERNYEPDIPTLCLRGGLMEQVFLNLIINAKDALLEKSEMREESFEKMLRIDVRKIQENHSPIIDADRGMGTDLKCDVPFFIPISRSASSMVRITFRDTGTGIKPKNLDRVFDPFFTTKRDDKGTGLGLSISYGIIKDHHGSIKVESQEGEFTIFTIDLPINQATTT